MQHQPTYCPSCGSELGQQIIDGISRLACESSSCRFVHWNNPIPVVAALVRSGGAYILGRNANWPNGLFSMLTGFVEAGESPEAAVCREVAEELGLEVHDVRLIGHFPFRDRNQLIIAFACEARGTVVLGDEISETRQVADDELSDYDFGPLRLTQEVVARWLEIA